MADNSVVLVPVVGRPFVAGVDPRRNIGGRTRKEILEARELMLKDLPAALLRLQELMRSDDERVALAATVEVLDRTMGKPKPVDLNADEREHMIEKLRSLKERMRPDAYADMLHAMVEESK